MQPSGFGGAERTAKPSEPIKALLTTYLHTCIRKKNYNYQSSKAETLLLEAFSRGRSLACCCVWWEKHRVRPWLLLGSPMDAPSSPSPCTWVVFAK